jgi:Peptidase family M28
MVLGMLNGRLYRAAFLPLLFALAIAAFSVSSRPRPLTSTLAPDAFDGARAFADLRALAAEFPNRRPGSSGDEQLATRVSHMLEALGPTAGGGFTVRTRRFAAQTIDGERTLTTVIAQRPGSTNATPLVILAHRDAAASGDRAELSGTAALLELARVFAARETQRTIVLVSTSGGSGGDAGAADFAAHARGPFDATIVLGDVAGAHARKPFVVPFSDGFGSAPTQLQRTVAAAITQETGSDPGAPSVFGQLAHLAFRFTVGEQGPLDAAGIPAVLVQVSGERGPPTRDAVTKERLEGFGRAVLSAVDALDTAPDVSPTMETGVLIQRKAMPEWALRLLTAALLLPPLIVAADGWARVRRRREPVRRWTLWTLACALPFFACALFARLLGALGVIGAAPATPVPPGALPFDGAAVRAVLATVLALALAWLLWPALMRRLDLRVRPDSEAAGLAMLLVLVAVCLIVWAVNPFTVLLLLPAAHLLLLIVSPELRPRPLAAAALVAIAFLPLILLVSFYADQLGLGPGEVAWTAVLLFAGGHIGVPAAILWSLALGCGAATAMIALTPATAPLDRGGDDRTRISIRGPLSYAGPGSLGGTESALRR